MKTCLIKMEDVKALVLHSNDNVATAVDNIEEKSHIYIRYKNNLEKVYIKQPIPFGHKLSIKKIKKGQKIIKYGECIGKATSTIEKGKHVHVHNVEGIRGRGDIDI